jgi:hypothetical protein
LAATLKVVAALMWPGKPEHMTRRVFTHDVGLRRPYDTSTFFAPAVGRSIKSTTQLVFHG